MSARIRRTALIALVLCVTGLTFVPHLLAGTPGDTTYSLVATVGGGWARYLVSPGGPPPGIPSDHTKGGFAGTARVMWYPNHLIRVGLESGWTTLYSYSFGQNNEGKEYLSAVPLLTVWSMNVFGVDLFAGAGYYLLNSQLDYLGTTSTQTWSLGWMGAASYTHKLSENWGIAGEVKWMNATESEDAVLTFQVQLVWKFFEW